MGWVDFGYAPPFAEVWDAMHVACNAMKIGGTMKKINLVFKSD